MSHINKQFAVQFLIGKNACNSLITCIYMSRNGLIALLTSLICGQYVAEWPRWQKSPIIRGGGIVLKIFDLLSQTS